MITLGTLLVYHSLTLSFAANLYSLKDLQVLDQEKNFEEFLMHVNDIRPSERQKLWKDMYQSMAIELVDYKTRTKDFSMEAYKKVEEIGRSSVLFNDEFFQLKRSIYAKTFFKQCYHQASEKKDLEQTKEIKTCDAEMSSYWYFSKKDPDIGLEFAKLIERYPSKLQTWPYYQRAINDSIANLYCERPIIHRAVIKKLTEESFDSEFDGNYKNLIKRFVPDKCFQKIIPSLRLGLQSTLTNGLQKEMAMNLLSASGNLTKEEEELYAVLYMLDGPVVGDKMNLAWKKIEDLSLQYTKRVKILAQIKSLPLIPDKIFKDPSLPRNKAIINLFAKNFPEYLNFYGESCVKYLQNIDEFSGNIASRLQCNEFLKTASELKKSENTDWVNDSVRRSYSGLKR